MIRCSLDVFPGAGGIDKLFDRLEALSFRIRAIGLHIFFLSHRRSTVNRTVLPAVAILLATSMYIGAGTAKAKVVPQTTPAAQPSQVGRPAWGDRPTARHDTFIANWIGADNECEMA